MPFFVTYINNRHKYIDKINIDIKYINKIIDIINAYGNYCSVNGGGMNKRLKHCPVCDSNMEIVEYHCPKCDISIKGRFGIGDLASLSVAQQEFVKVFVCSGGNIKEVEKVLGISYPTVKNRLNEISRVLCRKSKGGTDSDPVEILDKLEKGELSVEAAIKEIKKRG